MTQHHNHARISMFAAMAGLAILAFLATTDRLNASTPYAPMGEGIATRTCGRTQPYGVSCLLNSPEPMTGNPTESVLISPTGAIAISMRITLTQKTFDPLFFNAQPMASVHTGPVTTTNVFGTLIEGNTVAVLTVTQVTLPSSPNRVKITFYVNVDAIEDIEADVYTNRATSDPPATPLPTVIAMPEPRARLPFVSNAWCQGGIDNDWCEKNDSFDTAFVITPTLNTLTSMLNLTTDRRDYYKITIRDDLPYSVSLKKLSGTGDLDLYVYAADRTQACASAFTGISDEQIRFNVIPCSKSVTTPLTSGTYFILVYAFSGTANTAIPYTVSISQP
jgi:hypothetical protein